MTNLMRVALPLVLTGCVRANPTPLPAVDNNGTLNVAILIMPGLFISEATIPFDVYKHVRFNDTSPMNVYFVAETSEVDTAFGTKLGSDYTFANAPTRTDILVVPSGRGSHYTFLNSWYGGQYQVNTDSYVGETAKGAAVTFYGNMSSLMTWVNQAASTAKIITSHCWGAFTLAEAGLLNGKTVTTFPGYTQTLKEHYPAIASVVDNQRFVIDGKVMTSNGGLAAFEACIYIVRHIYGDDATKPAGITSLVFSDNNIGHSKLEYYKPSPTGCNSVTPDRTWKVGVLLLHGMFISEPVGPWDVFAHGIKDMSAFFVSDDMTPKITYYGAKLFPDYTFNNHPGIDILVVPSGIGSHWSFLEKFYSGTKNNSGVWTGKTSDTGNMSNVINFVKDAAAKADYVTSHCWGAFTLADAGILNDKTTTTFPGYGTDLQKYYPRIRAVIDDKRIIQHGKIITSNGGVAAYEGPVYVLKLIYGECQAKALAIGLVYAEDNYNVVNSVLVVPSCDQETDGVSPDKMSAFAMLLIMVVGMH